jgi:hypothetical protein
LDDIGLPPRYGMVTTNISESLNHMIQKARDGSWLFTKDTIVGTIVEKFCEYTDASGDNIGPIREVFAEIRHQWDDCVNFKVYELQSTGKWK